ncbi:MAG: substrate-binding domain-containing protein [Oscillospiraceae bacterium]|jgi:phosphate transport system substrate-binding protein|nr:substrate-binding domain-containing protein [Oscillospiraceae bacterium]
MPWRGIIILFVGLPLTAWIAGIATKNKIAGRIGGSILCAEMFFILWLFMELFADSGPVRQIFGTAALWLTFVICGGLLLLCLLLIWKPFAVKPRRVAAISLAAVLVMVTGSVAGIQAYENSVLEVPEGDNEISLRQYKPFDEASLLANLDEPSALTLSENLPRLDGATALYPLYAAFVQATYPAGDNYHWSDNLGDYGLTYEEYTQKYALAPEDTFAEEQLRNEIASASPVVCSRTQGAFENLLNGDADVVFLMDVSGEQRRMAENRGLELKLTPIGSEAFVFLVNSRNKIDGLTQDEVRAVYSGKITDWSGIDQGSVKGNIEAYQRPEGSGSQTALQRIMGGTPIIEPKETQIYSMMMGLYTAIADYKNYKNAIGYSFRYYIRSMLNDAEMKKVKLLAIDGVAPTTQTIADGTYPFAADFYAVTVAKREYKTDKDKAVAGNAQRLIDWILSAQGQSLVEKTGYVKLQGN